MHDLTHSFAEREREGPNGWTVPGIMPRNRYSMVDRSLSYLIVLFILFVR